MKIIGGSFGASGSLKIAGNNQIHIKSAQNATYPQDQIASISANTSKESKFGALGFIVGAIVLGSIGLALGGVIGLIIGILLSLAGSFYSKQTHGAVITFTDHKTTIITGSKANINQILSLH